MTQSTPSYPKLRGSINPFDADPALYEFEPIQRVEIWDGSQPWVIRENEMYRELISDPRISNDIRRDGYPAATPAFKTMRVKEDGLVTFDRRDGEEHMKSRQIILKFFSVRRMNQIRPNAEAHLAEILDDFFASPPPGDIVDQVSFDFTMRVLAELLGLPYAELKEFQSMVEALIHTAGRELDDIMASHAKVRDYIRGLVTEARTNPSPGAISEFVQDYLLTGVLTEDEVVANTISILMGGFETSANAMALGTAALMSSRDQWEDLCANADDQRFLMNATEEILRFITLVHWGRRRVAIDDIAVDGVTIKAGDGIIFDDMLANRDPAVFEGDLSKLDLRRDTRRHLVFAAGPHHCPGSQLARMELQSYFRTLAQRAPQLELAVPFSDLKFSKAQIYGVEELLVKW